MWFQKIILFFKKLFGKKSKERVQESVISQPLERNSENPLVSPGRYAWRAVATMNPTALVDEDGGVHLIYRAIGSDGLSSLGYAFSPDGIHVTDQSVFPLFLMNRANISLEYQYFDPTRYPSGGSWGGCEDPRMVRIGDRVYVTFNAFEGWDSIRTALIHMPYKDFIEKKWNWSPITLLSRSGERHKNWVLFPEKINGKFALLHSIHSTDDQSVQIEYIHDFDTYRAEQMTFESTDPHALPNHRCAWHDRIRSAGPAPVKTDQGWLLFYHANDLDEPHRYKLGVMLLDLNDPSKILYRSPEPVLVPDAWYENDGKPGIVYACGAVIRGAELLVYYGAGDRHLCVAQANLQSFLDTLVNHGTPAFTHLS